MPPELRDALAESPKVLVDFPDLHVCF